MEKYDVAIIGSGPAGMSAALELVKLKPGAKIAIFEQGKIRAPANQQKKELSTCGWGGKGTCSDGKLNFSWESGGQLIDVLSEEEFRNLMTDIDRQYLNFCGRDTVLKRPDEVKAKELKYEALAAGFKNFIYYPTRHWGTDVAHDITESIRIFLAEAVDIYFETKITCVTEAAGKGKFLLAAKGKPLFKSSFVIMAGGRGSNEQTSQIAESFDLKVEDNGVDIGVRLETLAECFEKFTSVVHSPKLLYNSQNGKEVRTFCICPWGFVKLEESYGVLTVNGESYSESSRIKSPNTNFAILVHETFDGTLDDPIGYGNKIASLANHLGKTVIVQAWSDFLKKRRSTPKRIAESGVVPTLKEATPGSIGSVLPYDFMLAIAEFIEGPLRKVAPAMNPDTILVYGGEIKQYAKKIIVDKNCESARKGLFFIGDGSGWTRGIMQASMQGILASRHIAKNYL